MSKNLLTKSPRILIALLIWVGAAIVVGAFELMTYLVVPPPAIALGLAIVLLLVYQFSSTAKADIEELGAGLLVGFHLIRIAAGSYFLILYNRGQLAGEFALPAGWGDIVVGITAGMVLLTCIPVRTPLQRKGLMVWNFFGLLDIILVLSNGLRLLLEGSGFANPFTALPLALLPLLVIPLILFSHVMLFVWSVNEF